MANRYFLDRVALSLILSHFPTTSVLILQHRPITTQLGRFHLIAYWLVNAVCFWQAWQLINRGENSSFYVHHEWRRRVVAMLAVPAALIVANLLFPLLVEGYTWPGGTVIALFVALGIVAGAGGFVGTRERPIPDCGEKDLAQARRMQRGAAIVFGAILPLLGGIAAGLWPTLKQLYADIANDRFLTIGAILVIAMTLGTFFLYPWLLVRSMERQISAKRPPSR